MCLKEVSGAALRVHAESRMHVRGRFFTDETSSSEFIEVN